MMQWLPDDILTTVTNITIIVSNAATVIKYAQTLCNLVWELLKIPAYYVKKAFNWSKELFSKWSQCN